MEPQTDAANMRSWLGTSPQIKITAYIENCVSTLNIREAPLSRVDFYETLRKFSVPFRKDRSAILEPQLDLEFQAWDALSDEALMNFEQELN